MREAATIAARALRGEDKQMEMTTFALVFGLGMVAGFLLAVALLGVLANFYLREDYAWPVHLQLTAPPTPPTPST